MTRGRGRPPANSTPVSPDKILDEALIILDAEGLSGLTMRALARRLDINPMTIYRHFKDRDGLIRALADSVYADIGMPETGDNFGRAKELLLTYYAKVVLHPALTLAIFAKPAIFPDHAKRITNELTSLLSPHLSSQRSLRWTHILVDYTHGAALAVANQDGMAERSLHRKVLEDFDSGLTELFTALQSAAVLPS